VVSWSSPSPTWVIGLGRLILSLSLLASSSPVSVEAIMPLLLLASISEEEGHRSNMLGWVEGQGGERRSG
jgi:hypothetical protein